jgi:hypothetical protein
MLSATPRDSVSLHPVAPASLRMLPTLPFHWSSQLPLTNLIRMPWHKWVIAGCALLVAGFWSVDGVHAFVTGSLITPSTREYAGQYGPWKHLVAGIELDPRGDVVHSAFLVLGIAWLAIITAWIVTKMDWSHRAMLLAAIGSLWYLPLGTVLGLIQIGLLLAFRNSE